MSVTCATHTNEAILIQTTLYRLIDA